MTLALSSTLRQRHNYIWGRCEPKEYAFPKLCIQGYFRHPQNEYYLRYLCEGNLGDEATVWVIYDYVFSLWPGQCLSNH